MVFYIHLTYKFIIKVSKLKIYEKKSKKNILDKDFQYPMYSVMMRVMCIFVQMIHV